VSWVRGQDLNL